MKEGGSCAHRLKPQQRVVVNVVFKRHGHQAGAEFCNGPDDGEVLQFSGGISFFRLVEGARSTADNALLTSRTCTRITPRPALDVSVYNRNGRRKSGKAVMGLVVRRVLRRSKVSWQSGPQWKTTSFLVSAWGGPAMAAKFLT